MTRPILLIALLAVTTIAQTAPSDHVVLVVLGGGVRTKDTVRHEQNTPNLKRIAEAGALFPSCKVRAATTIAAQRAVLTGVMEEAPRERHLRGPHATVGERLRKRGGLAAADVWFVLSGGGGETLLSRSDHVDHGPAFAPCTLAPDVLLSSTLREQLSELGISLPPSESDEQQVNRLLSSLDPDRTGGKVGSGPGSRSRAAVTRFLLEEAVRPESGKAGESDARALRAAQALFLGGRPRFMCVVLRDAAIAGRSAQRYTEVLKRNDAGIGALWDGIQKDPELAKTTTFIVVSDHGRNRKVDAKGALGYDDGSHDATRVALIIQGSRFKRKETIRIAVNTIDVAPTICHLLGVKSKGLKGRTVRAAFKD